MQRALEAAFAAHQWVKAEQILGSLDKQIALKYYKRIAAYYASVAQYKVPASTAHPVPVPTHSYSIPLYILS